MRDIERRHHEIFRLLREGKKAHEIEEYLAKKEKRYEKNKKRGDQSEKNAQEALSTLPYIMNATIIHDRFQDREKRDIIIRFDGYLFHLYLNQELHIPKSICWVQVKSSQDGMDIYRERIISQFDIEPDWFDAWMREHRLVLINGSESQVRIIESFEPQLRLMNEYWTHVNELR